MKHFDKLLLSCALVLVLDGCKDNASLPVDCQPLKVETRSVVEGRTFVFPEIQWHIYDTHEQKVAACQIPVELQRIKSRCKSLTL